MTNQSIFQQKSLEQLASPDELDRLLVVVTLRGWVPLWIMMGVCASALAWGAFGRIPVTVTGQGVLISPGNVKSLQSKASGQLVDLALRVGQRVEAGQTIGTLNQSALKTELEQATRKLEEVERTTADSTAMDEARRTLEKTAFQSQREFLTNEIQRAQTYLDGRKAKNESFTTSQRDNLMTTKSLTEKSHESLKKFFGEIKNLKNEGLASGQTLLETERQFNESQLRLANIDVQLRELELREIENAESQATQQNRIADLTLQLKKIEIDESRAEQTLRESKAARNSEIADLKRNLERLKHEIESQSQLQSPYSGRCLDILVSPGHVIQAGDRLGTIEIDDPLNELKSLAYFEVKDGKKISPGMAVFVTPSTVAREREGSIIGKVTKCSKFPISQQGAANIVGSSEIAEELTGRHGMIEVEAELERNPSSTSGFRWTSRGPDLKFSAGTTTGVRVTVEQRAPLTYVLPILRTWFLGAKDQVKEDH